MTSTIPTASTTCTIPTASTTCTIPKIVFTYWEGDQLSYLHYYTILSLVKLNPGMEIRIYTAKVPSNTVVQWSSGEHSVRIQRTIPLKEICAISQDITLIPIDFEKDYSITHDLSVVYKADFIRISKLYEHGGLWFDFDLLFIKPLPSYLFETGHDMTLFVYHRTIPTGFLSSTPKNKYITNLYTSALERIRGGNIGEYQHIGPDLWRTTILHSLDTNVDILENDVAYPYMPEDCSLFFNSNTDLCTDSTICVHWFNGSKSAKQYINTVDFLNINPTQSVCSKYVHMISNL